MLSTRNQKSYLKGVLYISYFKNNNKKNSALFMIKQQKFSSAWHFPVHCAAKCMYNLTGCLKKNATNICSGRLDHKVLFVSVSLLDSVSLSVPVSACMSLFVPFSKNIKFIILQNLHVFIKEINFFKIILINTTIKHIVNYYFMQIF